MRRWFPLAALLLALASGGRAFAQQAPALQRLCLSDGQAFSGALLGNDDQWLHMDVFGSTVEVPVARIGTDCPRRFCWAVAPPRGAVARFELVPLDHPTLLPAAEADERHRKVFVALDVLGVDTFAALVGTAVTILVIES